MRVSWSWKEGVLFAFAGDLVGKEDSLLGYNMSPTERFGTFCLRPLYKCIDYVSRHIKRPVAIVLFTFLAALFAVVVFYKIPALIILGKVFPSRFVRFLFFVYVELLIFGMGCRAIGRFNNPDLIKLWKDGKLAAIFPGDNRYSKNSN